MIRRGELSSGQLVMIILAVAGFAIAMLFLFGIFKNQDLTERELCRLSVLSRATVPGVAQQAVPLNCFTEKVCITVDDGSVLGIGGKDNSCKQFAGEKNVRTVEVKLGEGLGGQKAIDTIQREVANSMFDCWMMTGQGKMDIFKSGEGGFVDEALDYTSLSIQQIKPKCIVCSRVAFSDALTSHKNANVLKEINYNEFMSREKVPGSSLTYFQAFTDEGIGSGYGAIGSSEDKLAKYYDKLKDDVFSDAEVEEIKAILFEQFGPQISLEDKAKINDLKPLTIKSFFNNFDRSVKSKDNQIAIVFTQIKVPSVPADTQFWNTLRNGAIVGGFSMISGPGKIASFLIPGAGWVKALVKVAAVGATSLNLALTAEGQTGTNQALSVATCGKFESKVGGEQQGCSLVKLVNWDVNTINSLCTGGIEGNL